MLESIVLNALKETLTGKNLSIIADEIYKQHNAKLLGENPVKILEKELTQINKAINNIMKALELGIITDSTKERLQELETTRRELQEKLIFERMQEKTVLEKKDIESYLKKGVEQEPELMIELLVEKVFVFSDDHIEIMLHYTNTPIKPKPIEYGRDESPEGENLRGALIYTTKIFVDNEIFKGMNKKILEPTFKETQKMPVLIEIRG